MALAALTFWVPIIGVWDEGPSEGWFYSCSVAYCWFLRIVCETMLLVGVTCKFCTVLVGVLSSLTKDDSSSAGSSSALFY